MESIPNVVGFSRALRFFQQEMLIGNVISVSCCSVPTTRDGGNVFFIVNKEKSVLTSVFSLYLNYLYFYSCLFFEIDVLSSKCVHSRK